MAIRVEGVGHVVLKVRDLERATAFYRDAIGLTEVARMQIPAGRMAFFSASGGNHHDLAVLEVGPDAPPTPANAVGLFHVAFKIGNDVEALRAARYHLAARGITRVRLMDHTVSQSIYLTDPDGNGLELFVDADSRVWRDDPASVANARPFSL